MTETLCQFVRLLLKMAAIMQQAKQQQLPLSLNSQGKSGTYVLIKNIQTQFRFYMYTHERGPTPHFGLNFLLRSNVYSNMCPCVAALEKHSSKGWFMRMKL